MAWDNLGTTNVQDWIGTAVSGHAALSFRDMPSYKPKPLFEPETYMAKKRQRVAWSAEHVRTLKSMAKRKSTASKIAKALKRTEGATRQKAFSIGLSLNSRA